MSWSILQIVIAVLCFLVLIVLGIVVIIAMVGHAVHDDDDDDEPSTAAIRTSDNEPYHRVYPEDDTTHVNVNISK